MKLRTVSLVLALCLLVPILAVADSYEEKRMGVGARLGYSFIPGTFLNMGFDEYQSLNTTSFGLQGIYGFGAFDLVYGMDNYWLTMPDGEWLEKGMDEDEDMYYVESDFGLINLDTSIVWKWRVHPAVEPVVGFGLALGFPYGTIDVDRYHMGSRRHKPEEKQMPGVIPTIKLQTGCRFYPTPDFMLSLDMGIQYGFYLGLGGAYFFDI